MKLLYCLGILLGGALLLGCQGSRQLVSPDSDSYTVLKLGASSLAETETADLFIQCIGCNATDAELASSINRSANLEGVPTSELESRLAAFRYQVGVQVTIDMTLYVGSQAVFQSCAGEAPGCASYLHRIRRTSVQELPVRFEPIDTKVADVEKADPAEGSEAGSSLGTISTDERERPAFSMRADESFEPGHCFGKLMDRDGENLGIYAGHFTGSVCLVPVDGRIEVINQNIQFVSRKAREFFELRFADPLDLIGNLEDEDLQALAVGQQNAGGVQTNSFICKDADSLRYGQAMIAADGSNNFFGPCQLTVNLAGEPLPIIENSENYLLLGFRKMPANP